MDLGADGLDVARHRGSEGHREVRQAPGCPRIPPIDVQVRSTDRCRVDAYEDLPGRGARDGDLDELRPRRISNLPQGSHRLRYLPRTQRRLPRAVLSHSVRLSTQAELLWWGRTE